MNIYWLAFCAILLASAFGGGMYTEHKFDEAAVLAIQKKLDANTQAAMKTSNTIDTSFSQSTAHLHQLEESANQRLEALNAKPVPSANCHVAPGRLSILDAAIAARPSAR